LVVSGYQFSDPFTFTFQPGITYGLTAIADSAGTYGFFTDQTPNAVGAFSFLTGNQNVGGTFAHPVLNLSLFCFDVGTALVLTPQPASLLFVGSGLFVLLPRRMRRATRLP